MTATDTIVIALGGNAIARAGDDGTIDAQYRRAQEAMSSVAGLLCAGAHVVLTHGNGPVVGNIVLRGELASGQVPPMPLFIAGADSEGGIGLMLQQTLGNEMRKRGSSRVVASIITQVVVDAEDPAFKRPTKPIGSFYSADDARRFEKQRSWTMAEQHDGRWRRVVASPRPQRVVEVAAVRAALDAGVVPIACGGGGVPVTERPDGMLEGVDAVIDKDWTSALLAEQIGADMLVILMEVEGLYLDWGTPSARLVDKISAADATSLLKDGTLSEGSIAPKVAAAAHFASASGKRALLCRTEDLGDAVEGRAGTSIVP
ncbi:MAG TPA: carbamate kinase [Coriobacteriia bacterium]|nr:carbamate kinase [Coriobacteriia bacterium]